MAHAPDERLEILLLNWRDRTHPQGGGSEVFAETVAAGLARRGHRVTIFCARHPGSAAETVTAEGVRIVRAGGRLGVYPASALRYWTRRLGRPDVIVDVQNGLPFFARTWSRTPTVLLCHHVHREQWPVVLGPTAARVGWWIESRVSPRVHRGATYVTVSDVSRHEIVQLGVDPDAITVVHNGVHVPAALAAPRSANPSLVVLGRLVPHKRVEIALDAVARLRPEFPDLTLTVAGRGWWREEILAHRDRLGLDPGTVDVRGWISEAEKDVLLSRSWLSLVPSLKEGWGIAVMEAAAHGTPSIAFRDAGGVAESVVDGVTGLLADDVGGFVAATRRLLIDRALRERMSEQARVHAAAFAWEQTVVSLESVLSDAARESRAARERTSSGRARGRGAAT